MSAVDPELREIWRARASLFRAHGIEDQAVMLEHLIAEADGFVSSSESSGITVAAASALSGYCVDHLRRLLREKKLSNVGSKGRPLIRRSELPRKAAVASSRAITQLQLTSKSQVARTFRNKRGRV